ncbi:TPA: AmmeMemoRadiSam system protein B [Candidatus Falkowbacteria bacterium]|nr:AmmeMemoRadiSam system protein B [Candidatus Falkowbacteria bacterium]
MIVFAAVVPHPPLIIPSLGKDNTKKLTKTQEAFEILKKEFEAAKPDTVVIFSPHGDIYPDAFTINTLPEYELNFEDFGDFETRMNFVGDLGLINRFREQVETTLPVVLKSESVLDYGVGIPLYSLAQAYKNFKIMPINSSLLDLEQHLNFGEELKEAIFSSEKKVAIIASADLSHRLSKNAPAGFSPKAKDFDKKIIQYLKQKKVDQMIQFDSQLLKEAEECGLRPIMMLMGVIRNMNYDFQVLSYESPFGVGYLVGECLLK